MRVHLFCTRYTAGDGKRYAGPNVIAADWPDAVREAQTRGLEVLGELVCEIPLDAPDDFEISAAEVLQDTLAGETIH